MAKKDKPFNNPFAGLKLKLDEAKARKPSPPARQEKKRSEPTGGDDDAALFLQAVGEVDPVRGGRKGLAPPKEPPSAASLRIIDGEYEALTQLAELVTGEGEFDLADSDEFIEGSAPGLDPKILRRLRGGEYAVQAHLDLHGMVRGEAKQALEQFIHGARLKGHRCVLVVTGRGLHSKDQIPVLKAGVQAWLSHGRIGRQVLAFASARPQDGGSGAVYVLLRR